MAQIKGPAIFLAQFLDDKAPFNTLESITAWAKSLGFVGVQLPSWDARVIDLEKAASSKTYCDELKGKCNGLEITELATHLQGQLVAVHPAYDTLFDGFAAPGVRGNPGARTEWAVAQLQTPSRRHATSAWRQCPPSAARCCGQPCTRGRSAPPGWWSLASANWRSAGSPSWILPTGTAWISPTKSIPARTCTTA